MQAKVDEPRAGDFGLVKQIAEIEPSDDVLSDVARLFAERLGERHGAVGLIVAMLGILRRLDHRDVGFGIGDEASECGAEFVLDEVEEVHVRLC